MSEHVTSTPGSQAPVGAPAAYSTHATGGVPTAWVGWIGFAATMLVLVGLFNVIMGLVALFQEQYYSVNPDTLLVFDTNTWGWVHLAGGVLLVAVGCALFTGAVWARVAAVLLVGMNALAHLMTISFSPWWGVIVIAMDLLVIWAVMVHGQEIADAR
ncbi:MAG: hypothetical protein HOV94_27825 [Saccharothrix sp.]|nr:hypothetical protein [Saccharothrix sp.]